MMMNSDLSFLTYRQFRLLLSDEDVKKEISVKLAKIHNLDNDKKFYIEDELVKCDKDLFV